MHFPLLHLNWSGSLHFRSCAKHIGGSSSFPGQSISESQTQMVGMQRPELHLNDGALQRWWFQLVYDNQTRALVYFTWIHFQSNCVPHNFARLHSLSNHCHHHKPKFVVCTFRLDIWICRVNIHGAHNRFHLHCLGNPIRNKHGNRETFNRNFCLSFHSYLNPVALFYVVNTKGRSICWFAALHLLFKANKSFTIIGFVRIVTALIFTITNLYRIDAVAIFTLILTGFALEVSAWLRLIATIATIILCITNPIEWHALFDGCTLEFSWCTVCDTRSIVTVQVKFIGTIAFIVWRIGWQQTNCVTIGRCTWIHINRTLPIWMIHSNVHRPMNGCQQCWAIITTIRTRFNWFRLPICPVNAIFPDSHCKNVVQFQFYRWIFTTK